MLARKNPTPKIIDDLYPKKDNSHHYCFSGVSYAYARNIALEKAQQYLQANLVAEKQHSCFWTSIIVAIIPQGNGKFFLEDRSEYIRL